MKSKVKKIIRNLLIGSMASIFHVNAQDADISSVQLLDALDGDDKKDAVTALRNKIYKNVLQINRDGDTKMIAEHRSHGSHSSHSSHSSHRSGSSGGHLSHTSHYSSSGSGVSSIHSDNSPNSSISSTPTTPKPAAKTYKTYSLGDRTLTSGLYGNDVSILTSLLVSKRYLRKSWITMQDGYAVYNTRVVNAVKRFQKDAGLSQDGIVNSSTAMMLQNWDETKTTLVLGIRDISYHSDAVLAGDDVDELITLLRSIGFPPDPSKLEYKDRKAVFTKDIETAVKLFQAYNSLNANGVVDEATITKLNALMK